MVGPTPREIPRAADVHLSVILRVQIDPRTIRRSVPPATMRRARQKLLDQARESALDLHSEALKARLLIHLRTVPTVTSSGE